MMKVSIRLPLKSGFTYEGIWVKELSENTGEINNIPFFTKEYKFGDVIEFDLKSKEVKRLIQDGGYTPTEMVRYKGGFQAERRKWEACGYEVEGYSLGIMGVTRKRPGAKK